LGFICLEAGVHQAFDLAAGLSKTLRIIGATGDSKDVIIEGDVRTQATGEESGYKEVIRSFNAFHSNKTNFSGLATPTEFDVFEEPMLDFSTEVPTPKVGSPLIGAAPIYLMGKFSIQYDYYMEPRYDPSTIGAVNGAQGF